MINYKLSKNYRFQSHTLFEHFNKNENMLVFNKTQFKKQNLTNLSMASGLVGKEFCRFITFINLYLTLLSYMYAYYTEVHV